MTEQVDAVDVLVEDLWRCAAEALHRKHLSDDDLPPGSRSLFTSPWTASSGQRDAVIALAILGLCKKRSSTARQTAIGPAGRLKTEAAPEVAIALGQLQRGAEQLAIKLIETTRPDGYWGREALNSYGLRDLNQDVCHRLLKATSASFREAQLWSEGRIRAYIARMKRNLLIDKWRRDTVPGGSHNDEVKPGSEEKDADQTQGNNRKLDKVTSEDGSRASASRSGAHTDKRIQERGRIVVSANEFDNDILLAASGEVDLEMTVLPSEELRTVGCEVLARTGAADARDLISCEQAGLWLLEPVFGWSHEAQRACARGFQPFWTAVVELNLPPAPYETLPGAVLLLRLAMDLKLTFISSREVQRDLDVSQDNFNQLCTRMRDDMNESILASGVSQDIKLMRMFFVLRCFSLRRASSGGQRLRKVTTGGDAS